MAVSSATVGVGRGESERAESAVLARSWELGEALAKGCVSGSESSSGSSGRGLGGRGSSSWKNCTSS